MDQTLAPSFSVEAEIAELAALARRLVETDPAMLVFGSTTHQYHFGPTLSEAELVAFEARHGIQLPPDYRCFLAQVGNGAPGPDYGLLRLDDDGRDLTQPFPCTGDFELREDLMTKWENLPGLLCLCHHGCGHYSYLVVNGPAYGSVFVGMEETQFSFISPTFAAWYREWVEGKLRVLANLRLLDRIRPGMHRSDVEAMLPGDWSIIADDLLKWRKLRHPEVLLDIDLSPTDIVLRAKRETFV
jgi:hypothetical protein